MGMMKEFREFAMKGSVIDLAVGVIIGAAFGRVVSSVVADVIMPPIGLLVGGLDFSNLAILLKEGATPESSVYLRYGKFIQEVINFLIVAWAIFLMIKAINRFRRKEPEAAAPPAPPQEVVLLTEIRDQLRGMRAV